MNVHIKCRLTFYYELAVSLLKYSLFDYMSCVCS